MKLQEFESITDKARELLATPEPFRAWLAKSSPGRWVGIPSDCNSCPLHTFLTENLPQCVQVTVSTDGATVRTHATHPISGAYVTTNAAWIQAKRWHSRFVLGVDRREGPPVVYASDAMQTLEEAAA